MFTVQEQLIKETARFNKIVSNSLEKITKDKKLFEPREDLKKFYEHLSDAQMQVQNCKENWQEYEQSIGNLMSCLKSHSEFDVIDGNQLKSFMAENLVMNYSNVELHRVLMQ